MRKSARKLVALASIISGVIPGLAACSGMTSVDGSATRSHQESTSTAAAQSTAAEGEGASDGGGGEEGSSDVPIWVNGSYLTCDYDAVVGDHGRDVRLACKIIVSRLDQAITAWDWKVIGPTGAEKANVVVSVDGLSAVIEMPADLLSSVTLSATPTALPDVKAAVVSSVKDAVASAAQAVTPSSQKIGAEADQLLTCFADAGKAVSQCFADAGYTKAELVKQPGGAASEARAVDCSPGQKKFRQGTFSFVVPAKCVVTVSLWGGGGSGGGAVGGVFGGDSRLFNAGAGAGAVGEGGDSRLFILVAGGGTGGGSCALGGGGGDGGLADGEGLVFSFFDGDFGEDVEAGAGAPGGHAGSDADEVPMTGGAPGKRGESPGGGGGGATGIPSCGGGGGGGAYVTASFTLQDLIDAGASPSKDGGVEIEGEVGAGGSVPPENGNAGAGGDGMIWISWAPEDASEGR